MQRSIRLLAVLVVPTILVLSSSTVLAQTATTTATATVTPTPTPTPTITQQDAVNQAQTQVAAPQTVYDITDPGIVYGMLREGVDAWIATLGGNTDNWGNTRSSVYITAVRPDVVPASLQAFLLQHYSGHPTIGLAIGPEGVTAAVTQVQENYNQAVSNLADQIYDNAVQEAINNAQNNNAANNSENIPPLDNNDNGNNSNNDTPAEAPKISSISPSSVTLVAGSNTIDITGENFGTSAEAVTIDFSNGFTGVEPKSVSDTAISVEMPDNFIAGKGITVTVKVGDKTSNGVAITATPSIISINPQELLDSEELKVYGLGFDHKANTNNTLCFTGGGSPVNLKPTACSFDTGLNQGVLTITVGCDDVGGAGTYSLSVMTNGQESQTTSVEFTSSTT